MATIAETLSRLFPRGTNPEGRRSLRACPAWPPDLFAFSATLLESSSGYADAHCTFGWDPARYFFSDTYVKEVRRAAREWARTGNTPDRVTYLWNELRRFRQSNVATESLPILLR